MLPPYYTDYKIIHENTLKKKTKTAIRNRENFQTKCIYTTEEEKAKYLIEMCNFILHSQL